MKSIKVNVTPFDDYIPPHSIELNFSNEQIEAIEIAAISIQELSSKFSNLFISGEYMVRGIELNLPVAKWECEKYNFKTNHTLVHVFPKSFLISTHTEGLNILIESEEIGLDALF
jgi:hypothetical protein